MIVWSPSCLMYSSIFLGSLETRGKNVAKQYAASLAMPLQALDASFACRIEQEIRSASKLYTHVCSHSDSRHSHRHLLGTSTKACLVCRKTFHVIAHHIICHDCEMNCTPRS